MLTKSKAILKLIDENPELAKYIKVLENVVKQRAKDNEEWRKNNKSNYKAFLDFGTERNNKLRKFKFRKLTNEEKHILRNEAMLDYFHDLCDQHENPTGPGVRKKLRDQTYKWAVEQGYFTNEDTGENRKKPLKTDTLKYILSKPK